MPPQNAALRSRLILVRHGRSAHAHDGSRRVAIRSRPTCCASSSSICLPGLRAFRSMSGMVFAVTHGGFRRLLAAELVRRGWSHQTPWPQRRYHNWSAWTLCRGWRRRAPAGRPSPGRV